MARGVTCGSCLLPVTIPPCAPGLIAIICGLSKLHCAAACNKKLCRYVYCAFGGGGGTTKSETCGLWLIVKYLANARHILGAVLSTSIPAAKRRIWGSMVDLVRAVPALPLRVMASLNLIRYVSPT